MADTCGVKTTQNRKEKHDWERRVCFKKKSRKGRGEKCGKKMRQLSHSVGWGLSLDSTNGGVILLGMGPGHKFPMQWTGWHCSEFSQQVGWCSLQTSSHVKSIVILAGDPHSQKNNGDKEGGKNEAIFIV